MRQRGLSLLDHRTLTMVRELCLRGNFSVASIKIFSWMEGSGRGLFIVPVWNVSFPLWRKNGGNRDAVMVIRCVCLVPCYHGNSNFARFAKRDAGPTVAAAARKGDVAVVNDSDGGGRCCSARKRTSQVHSFHCGPAWSVSSCEDAAAFLYIQSTFTQVFVRALSSAVHQGLAFLLRITRLIPFPEWETCKHLLLAPACKGEMAV